MIAAVDMNADLGEGYGPWRMGDDSRVMPIVTSANIACGGHAGDPETMYRTLLLAREHRVTVGAHPGFPDREGFGRRRIPYQPGEITRFVAAQIGALQAIATLVEVRVDYVKPHGALGNMAAEDDTTANAILDAVSGIDPSLAILAISGTCMDRLARERGMTTFSEIFADRGYGDDGNLAPRSEPGAILHDPQEAASRIIRAVQSGTMPTLSGGSVALRAESVCIHGDSPSALEMATKVRATLEQAGIEIQPFMR